MTTRVLFRFLPYVTQSVAMVHVGGVYIYDFTKSHNEFSSRKANDSIATTVYRAPEVTIYDTE